MLKKFWWAILAVVSFLLGLFLRTRKADKAQTTQEQLENKFNELRTKQEELEKEAKEIENKKYFNDGDDAADYLNDAIRRNK
ncbi:MAG TPA: hypothetical protein PK584_05050 [Fervidobacterium sp.]|nr:hypothetical protein [Fervidobacterium sp.]